MIPIGVNQKTKIIYGLIRDAQYKEAINHLNYELKFCPKSQVMSLLGYCYYMIQDYGQACRIYEELTFLYPTKDEYIYYLALCFYKNSDFECALREIQKIDNPDYQERLAKLTSYIYYDLDDVQRVKSIINLKDPQDSAFLLLKGAIEFKEKKYNEAKEIFSKARNMQSENCEVVYNLALSHYQMKEYDKCMHYIAEIIEKGAELNQELCMGSRNRADEDDFTVGNSVLLKESALIEAFNLKAAIEFNLKNMTNAKEALSDMPPRLESELDPITLMNQALINFDKDPQGGFEKLNFLLKNPPFPQETFMNLLLMYVKYEQFDVAADELAENSELSYKYIKAEDYEYIEALIFKDSSQEESLAKLEELSKKYLGNLKKITKQIKEAQKDKESNSLQETLKDYDECLENYIPVLMAQAKIHWSNNEFVEVEKILLKAIDFCSINDTWKLNLAHVFYVQEKYQEALTYYEGIFEKNIENILELPAIIIANLCVCCIMVNLNERAEEIIRMLEEQDEKNEILQPSKTAHYHLCIVNLVIGTLYCAKNNFEFGISRIIRSFEPLGKKLCTDTWYYAKRCLLSLLERLSKFMLIVEDKTLIDIIQFLKECEKQGKNIKTFIDPKSKEDLRNNVTYEAKILRILFMKMRKQQINIILRFLIFDSKYHKFCPNCTPN